MNLSMLARRWRAGIWVSLCMLGAGSAVAQTAPAWQPNVFYTAGTLVSYNGSTYSALVNQTDYTATGWNPTTTSLWTLVSGSGSSSGSGSGGGSSSSSSSGAGSSSGSSGGTCAAAWSATQVYTGGNTASESGTNYIANYWTQGNNPATSNGPQGSGQPWTAQGSCSGSGSSSGGGSSSGSSGGSSSSSGSGSSSSGSSGGTPPPPPAFVYGPFKDVTISNNWNTNVFSTSVTGTLTPVVQIMPAKDTVLTWAFATGECGSESWAGITPSQVAGNIQSFINAGKKYIVSTGGQAGVFTCGSDANFTKFIQTYISSNMIGIDFDIEGGQSQDVINNLVARVKVAQAAFPTVRFSFTLQTLGGDVSPGLNELGGWVMSAIQANGISNYIIDLMTMDYGSTGPGNCAVVNGSCEMGQSAINAVELLHSAYGVPYNQIEITPDIGANDTQGEVFTLADVQTISTYARQKGLAGIHFWSFDRDTSCPGNAGSATCNGYSAAGPLGFNNAFISALGL